MIGVDGNRGPDPNQTWGQDSIESVQNFVAYTNVTFPVGVVSNASYDVYANAQYGISPYPLDLIIDQNGDVAYLNRQYDSAAMQEVLDTLVGN